MTTFTGILAKDNTFVQTNTTRIDTVTLPRFQPTLHKFTNPSNPHNLPYKIGSGVPMAAKAFQAKEPSLAAMLGRESEFTDNDQTMDDPPNE